MHHEASCINYKHLYTFRKRVSCFREVRWSSKRGSGLWRYWERLMETWLEFLLLFNELILAAQKKNSHRQLDRQTAHNLLRLSLQIVCFSIWFWGHGERSRQQETCWGGGNWNNRHMAAWNRKRKWGQQCKIWCTYISYGNITLWMWAGALSPANGFNSEFQWLTPLQSERRN